MDPEIVAMGEVAKALEPLDDEATKRVIRWTISRFEKRLGGDLAMPSSRPATAASPSVAQVAGAARLAEPFTSDAFKDFPSLFDAANPQTGLDRVLVAAFWYQNVLGQDDWDSQAVNGELKNMGHPSSNITRDLDSLIKRTPRLVLQVRKDGSTKQARKRYKLTREGIRAVETMMNVSAGGTVD